VDRCALFVDAGYALADGALAVHGTRHRDSVSWDYPGLLKLLGGLSRDRTGLPLLRCYWYEATVDSRRTAEHDTLADIPGLKLRLGKVRPGRREGVETEIRRDLTALARNKAVSDVIIVSAEEDLAQVISDVQDQGLRVALLHIATDGDWTISRTLRQECDDIIEISASHLRPYVDLIPGAEPVRSDDEPAPSGYHARGRDASSRAGATPSHQIAPVPALPAAPSLYPAPVAADYPHAAQQLAASAQSGTHSPAHGSPDGSSSGSAGAGSSGAGSVGSGQAGAGPVGAGSAGAHNRSAANTGGLNLGMGSVGPEDSDAGQGLRSGQPGQSGQDMSRAILARPDNTDSGRQAPGAGHSRSDDDSTRMPAHQQYQVPEQLRGSMPSHGQSGQGQGQNGMSQNGLTQGSLPQNGLPQNGLPQNGLPQGGLPQGGLSQNAMGQNGMTSNGQSGLPQNGLPQNGPGQNGPGQNGPGQGGLGQGGLPQGGIPQNGAGQNGITQNGITQNGPPPGSVPPQGQGPGRPGSLRNGAIPQQGQGALPQNGMSQNGLGQNGMSQNGLSQNGLGQNGQGPGGLPQGGSGQNGVPQNGMHQNGLGPGGLGQNGIGQNGAPQNGLPQNGLPQNGLPQNGLSQGHTGPQSALPNGFGQHSAPPQGPGTGELPLSRNGGLPQHGQGNQNGSQQAGLAGPDIPRSDIQRSDMQRPDVQRPDVQRPPGGQRQLPAGPSQQYGPGLSAPYGAGQPQQPQPPQPPYGGSYGPPVPPGASYLPQQVAGPYGGPQPPGPVQPSMPQPITLSLADAVQAAHAEGFSFGEAVARDAPALWLEAVVARKPRMPSDLEARLLQGSALPIDSLLHDEVRHALRRGFWDALERSRR
jgi:hypothetical protein